MTNTIRGKIENVPRDVRMEKFGKYYKFGKRIDLNKKKICKSQMGRDPVSRRIQFLRDVAQLLFVLAIIYSE